ncbi:hypothetical protein [Cellulomonas fimi]|uniref:Uncharacterized protein n=1 Tax=Cellulomonas fimi (strain ATCC 484 / DSM 20113 / JCM 1341 / CCUG 24087 / LMG 16345 / NBRC 15513 / NCIMB 8980 / NCTC 7547 / NRS-133) TaxID=590998 RepID=F4H6D0_CELFA|nr:hypothetical protein [Cellulomonas fimi]AEE44442.1 hypothetical protein Celf_0297 [Cellulomonas fimi ATCC 484]NNH06658.1 hypothetical protein [Cellulomonas fimi]VEH26371.1 Uncharacterised protein [Cellulomonas fimi]
MQTDPTPRSPATPPTGASTGIGRELARGLVNGLLEVAVWAVAVVVVVGGLGLLGHTVGGGVGMLVGAGAGVLVLAVAWVVLLVVGASLVPAAWRAAAAAERDRPPRPAPGEHPGT